ncbi:hypothetical protein [Candidatus Laterigemmans baculatus]|uniref:hypothetical protein n=1 Tax=Candidatus Laterigemmans baculatus TaxID=2770505 RepID=UPI0013DAF1E0|nr:hypothetical protein [Candidatus Laterigemmans baculatus]
MFFFDPFATVIALLPLATYLLLLGGIRFRRRPLATTGVRDGAAVALAISGLMVVGPLHLFFPSTAAIQLGWWTWVLLVVLYLLCVSLLLFSFPQRIVIYGVRARDILEPLEAAARTVDPAAVSTVERMQVSLPERRVHLRVEPLGWTHAVAIEAFEKHLHPEFWNHLLRELRERTHAMQPPSHRSASGMVAAGSILMAIAVYQIVGQPTETLAGFREWLGL